MSVSSASASRSVTMSLPFTEQENDQEKQQIPANARALWFEDS